MKKDMLITLPKLSTSGGVSSFWNSLLPVLEKYEDLNIETLEIGGHGKKLYGPIIDQWKFYKKTNTNVDLAFLNPSLGSKSFFRDALFAKRLSKKNISFLVFFHGWNLDFEKKVDEKYINFFLRSFGQAKKIFVLSKDFKNKILEWGYQGDVIIETTNVDNMLLKNFSIKEKFEQIKTAKKIRILFLARLLREKGVFETVEAFEYLLKKFKNIELIVAGDGKDYDELKTRVEGNENIIVAGYVQGEDKIDLFRKSHIYCFPTYYGEGLPTSILEAMAFGLPVITTDVGGLKEFFQDEKMGFFVNPKDVRQLSEKLELLILDSNKVIKIGKYNYQYANDKLLNIVVAERMYQYIKSILINQ